MFVVVAGVVLLFGTAAFIYLFLEKRESDRAAEALRQTGAASTVVVPDGARIVDLRFEQGRVLTHLRDEEGRNFLMLVDVASGRRLGLVVLEPETP
ncbi:MAG: hypothetical protein EA356_01190 [Geminicoccaceae bacterium]|nr:MAG: hypothetical protein EA356_01190 [Geminicoccaceae bacterium]